MTTPPDKPFQFGLGKLLAVVTGAAIFIWLVRVASCGPETTGGMFAGIALAMIGVAGASWLASFLRGN
jgi:hypothetical protein